MLRKVSVVLLVPVIALALVACDEAGPSTTYINSAEDPSGVTVSGLGEVIVEPDTGFFNVGVQVTAKTVSDARDKGARAADDVINSLKKNRIDEKDIKTTGLSIYPVYEYPRNGEPKVTGYTLSNTVQVKVRKLDQFSKVIDDSLQAGGDAVRLSGIRFDIEDTTKALEQAREAAMADAKKKAEQLAKAGGVGLDRPISIQETQSSAPPPEVLAAAAPKTGADAAPSTPIQKGTGTVTVQVLVRWGIKK